MRRFAKGDKVLALCSSRRLPIAEVLEVYEAADGQQVLLVAYADSPQRPTFVPAEDANYIGERKFIAAGPSVYRVSNGKVVAESDDLANVIADFLETFTPLLDPPGDWLTEAMRAAPLSGDLRVDPEIETDPAAEGRIE